MRKSAGLILLLLTFTGLVTAQPYPVVQELSIYDVDGLSTTERESGGDFVTSGLNETFSINHSDSYREYRFEFLVENEGDQDWSLEEEDVLRHENLSESWEINDIWYNTTADRYFSGTFENGIVTWNTSQGGTIGTGENLYAKYLVNVTTEDEDLRSQRFEVNNTGDELGSEDYHVLDVKRFGYLEPVLEEPPNDTKVQMNKFFQMVSSVTCREGVCGQVEASIRYNETSTADTLIQEDSGEPFYTNTSNTATCSERLGLDETCQLDWHVNATGEKETYHLLDTNASSSYALEEPENDSLDNQVQINEILMVETLFDSVDFGLLDPGESNNSATGNDDLLYNITVPEESNRVDNLWIRATEMEHEGRDDYIIPPENASVSLENDIDTSWALSSTYQLLDTDISPGSVFPTFYWLDVPYGIYSGEYNGTLHFKVNSTG